MYESFTKLSAPVRLAYLSAACVAWTLTLGGRLRRGRVVILCYHNVRPDQRARFERQLRAAAQRIIPLSAVNDEQRHSGQPRIVFTFDDAYANLLTTVAPAMRSAGAPWSVFPVSGVLGVAPTWTMPEGHPDRTERTMTRDELRSLADDPLVEIGAHTATHPALADVSDADRLDAELTPPREAISALSNRPVASLALPHGSFDAGVLTAADSAGYSLILTLQDALEPRGVRTGNAAVLGRFSCSPDIWPVEFRLLIDGAYSWLGSFRTLMRRVKGARP